MNCLEFRRQLLAEPFSKDQDLLLHEAECPDCAPFARDVRAQEVHLRSALLEIRPPEGLAERVQLAARFERRSETRRRWWYSAAATVLMTIGVSMVSLFSTSLERGNVALAQSVLNHIEDEAHHLREAQAVSAGRLKWVFKRFGAELSDNIGPVNFAAECLMRKRSGVHLVLPGQVGPITVFFMPGETPASVVTVSSERFNGKILPTDWGSVAVIGEAGESLDGMGERLAAVVRWPQPEISASGLLDRSADSGIRIAQQQDS